MEKEVEELARILDQSQRYFDELSSSRNVAKFIIDHGYRKQDEPRSGFHSIEYVLTWLVGERTTTDNSVIKGEITRTEGNSRLAKALNEAHRMIMKIKQEGEVNYESIKDLGVDLIDEHFPKGQCQERGQAIVLYARLLQLICERFKFLDKPKEQGLNEYEVNYLYNFLKGLKAATHQEQAFLDSVILKLSDQKFMHFSMPKVVLPSLERLTEIINNGNYSFVTTKDIAQAVLTHIKQCNGEK